MNMDQAIKKCELARRNWGMHCVAPPKPVAGLILYIWYIGVGSVLGVFNVHR